MTNDDMQTDFRYPMRLQKFLARAGVASRRGSETLMSAGRVTVNGVVASEMGTKVDPRTDVICVDNKRIELQKEPVYIMLNKPAGVLTTMHDPQNRPCVASWIPHDTYPGLFPVGRLDKDTTGLLLFTTDGDAAYKLLHPSHEQGKTYIARVAGNTNEEELDLLRQGIVLRDGPCAPAKVSRLDPHDADCASVKLVSPWSESATSVLSLTIHEGRTHQVKRMCKAIGHEVISLHRKTFGPLELKDVAPGKWRKLYDQEVACLQALCAKEK